MSRAPVDDYIRFISRHKPDISNRTAEIQAKLFIKLEKALDDKIYDPYDIAEYMAKYSVSYQRNAIDAAQAFLKARDEIEPDEEDNWADVRDQLRDMADKVEREKPKPIPPLDTAKLMGEQNSELRSSTDPLYRAKIYQRVVALLLYTLLPPRRAKDYFQMIIVDDASDPELSDEFNQYDGENFVINVYKTAKTYGQFTTEVPEKLNRAITQMLSARSRANIDSEFLFLNEDMEPMTGDVYSRFIQKATGLSVNELRRRYVADHVDSAAVREGMGVAKEMGHSVGTQQSHQAAR